MSDLEALLERMKAAQRELIDTAAKAGGLPTDKMLAKIADLEVAISALEYAVDSEAGRPAQK